MELVRLKPDVIVTHGGAASRAADRAAKEVGRTIPIVFAVSADPLGGRLVASSPTDIQPVLDAVAESAARLSGAEDTLIFRVEGETFRRVASSGPMATQVELEPRPLVRSIVTGRAILECQTIQALDSDPDFETQFPDSRAHFKHLGFRTLLATPMVREGVALGAIVIRRKESGPFSERQIALLKIGLERPGRGFSRLHDAVSHRKRD